MQYFKHYFPPRILASYAVAINFYQLADLTDRASAIESVDVGSNPIQNNSKTLKVVFAFLRFSVFFFFCKTFNGCFLIK